LISAAGGKRQVQITTRGSQRKTLAVTGAKVVPPDSDTEQTVLVLRDITDEEMGRRLHSYFLGNITHEFRTPLSGLKASIELLLDETDYLSPDEIHELLNSIHLSVSGLQSLVDNLLESVNIEGGRFSIHRRPVDLNQITAEAIRMMQPLLDRRKQWLSLIEPLQLPPVHADPTRLTQVMINLLANASKYSPQEKAIDLELGQVGESLKVTIADRGPGIPPNERANLFNRFVRLGAPTSEQYGIGLGLSVVKAIIEGHGGEVGVDERPGGGSVFWFTLPLVEKAGRDESSDC
jgi:signal transduction histidine kinase